MPKKQTEVQKEAFEFKVDYKPFENNLNPKDYAEYGFIKGAECVLNHLENISDMLDDKVYNHEKDYERYGKSIDLEKLNNYRVALQVITDILEFHQTES